MRLDIFAEVNEKRLYQEAKWGNRADDTKNTPNDWVSYIANHSTKWFPGGFTPYCEETVQEFRAAMVDVAALAVAAIESLDRQTLINGAPFYQE
jgi:hypothetical protein